MVRASARHRRAAHTSRRRPRRNQLRQPAEPTSRRTRASARLPRPCTIVSFIHPSDPNGDPYSGGSPVDGVITKFRIRVFGEGGVATRVTFRVANIRLTNPRNDDNALATAAGTGPTVDVPAPAPATRRCASSRPALSVAKGQHLGHRRAAQPVGDLQQQRRPVQLPVRTAARGGPGRARLERLHRRAARGGDGRARLGQGRLRRRDPGQVPHPGQRRRRMHRVPTGRSRASRGCGSRDRASRRSGPARACSRSAPSARGSCSACRRPRRRPSGFSGPAPAAGSGAAAARQRGATSCSRAGAARVTCACGAASSTPTARAPTA